MKDFGERFCSLRKPSPSPSLKKEGSYFLEEKISQQNGDVCYSHQPSLSSPFKWKDFFWQKKAPQ